MGFAKTVSYAVLAAAALVAIPVTAETPPAQKYMLTVDLHGEGGATQPAKLITMAGEKARFATGTEGARMFTFEATPVAEAGKIALSLTAELTQASSGKRWRATQKSVVTLNDAQNFEVKLSPPGDVKDKPVDLSISVRRVN